MDGFVDGLVVHLDSLCPFFSYFQWLKKCQYHNGGDTLAHNSVIRNECMTSDQGADAAWTKGLTAAVTGA